MENQPKEMHQSESEMSQDNWAGILSSAHLQSSLKNPGISALLSFFVMGLGQIFNGSVDRGIMFLFAQISCLYYLYDFHNNGFLMTQFCSEMDPLTLAIIHFVVLTFLLLLWIYNIKDACKLGLVTPLRRLKEMPTILDESFMQHMHIPPANRLLTGEVPPHMIPPHPVAGSFTQPPPYQVFYTPQPRSSLWTPFWLCLGIIIVVNLPWDVESLQKTKKKVLSWTINAIEEAVRKDTPEKKVFFSKLNRLEKQGNPIKILKLSQLSDRSQAKKEAPTEKVDTFYPSQNSRKKPYFKKVTTPGNTTTDLQLLKQRAWNLYRAGKLEEASEHYEKLLKLEPDSLVAHRFLGRYFARKKQYLKSLHHFERILFSLDSDETKAYKKQILVLNVKENPGKIIEYGTKFLLFKENDFSIVTKISQANEVMGNYANAYNLLKTVHSKIPAGQNYSFFKNMGQLQVKLGLLEESLVSFNQSLTHTSIKEEKTGVFKIIASVLEQLGRGKESKSFLVKTRDSQTELNNLPKKSSPVKKQVLSQAPLRKEKTLYKEKKAPAVKSEKKLKVDKYNPYEAIARQERFKLVSQMPQISVEYLKILSKPVRKKISLKKKATVKEYKGKVKISRSAKKEDKKVDRHALSKKAINLLRFGKVDEAKKLFSEILTHYPGDGKTLYYLGTMAMDRRDREGAIDYFKKAYENGFKNSFLLNDLGTLLFNYKRFPESARLFREATLLDSKNLFVRLKLAISLSNVGKKEEARTILDNLVNDPQVGHSIKTSALEILKIL
ncbi:tetratricopeptide repeat protein [Candidatus Riflebacteria bacterium]